MHLGAAACSFLLLLTCAAACSGGDDGPGGASATAPSGVSLSFGQLRNDEGTPRAQLRVVNESDQDLTVTGVGLDWPGYGKFVTDYDTVVTAGRTLDLRFELPEPDCAPTDEPVVGQLRIATGGEELVLRDELDESGAGYVTRIRERWCEDRMVADAVSIGYGNNWRIDGQGRRARMVGTVELKRTRGDERVVLRDLVGSVLLEVHLREDVVLAPGRMGASARVELDVSRCDQHALTESSQTFHFLAEVAVAEQPPVRVVRIPDAQTRAVAQDLLEETCVLPGSVG